MLVVSDILVLCVQIAVLLLVAGAFWRPVAAVVLLTCGLCALAFALVGQGTAWLIVGGFAVVCAGRSLQVSFLQVKYAGLDVFSVKAPEKAPSETELLDKLVARLTEFNTLRQERAAAAAAKSADTSTPAATAEPEPTQAGSRRTRSERLSASRRLARPSRGELPAAASGQADDDELPQLPHNPDSRKKRLDTSKTSPKAVA